MGSGVGIPADDNDKHSGSGSGQGEEIFSEAPLVVSGTGVWGVMQVQRDEA